ncbi:trans-sulfuration enzyme family protein [Ferroacidibacillus organovorans]|uniref:homocysteine desulfhydrase n=1 Tax=Ferroacidibacillus organovorans TaxID=1765683 RepID=A0A101XQB7_9BACL|nr:aminotransferase class I/II-fold pyridoxal phosphate-dependent enzyme [Ferroacidibacillus organovorans]KUO95542.1 hypothetical protein ATW55_06545 [Ferroacidibacillus organovorans]
MEKHLATRAARLDETHLHGEAPRPEVTPIYQSSVYRFDDTCDVLEYYEAKPNGRYLYGRNGHPNSTVLENALAALENASGAVSAASGMGAISAAVLSVCAAGDHVILSQDIYGGTLVLLRTVLARFGVSMSLLDLTDEPTLKRALERKTKLVIGESIANPLLTILDIAKTAEICHRFGALLMIDNTFATPALITPLSLGADIVVHSTTKYMGGHSDVSGGVVCANDPLIEEIRQTSVAIGTAQTPFDAWLVARGVKTLSLRVEKQCENATKLAAFLVALSCCEVIHPSLATHPGHELAKHQFHNRYGAMLSIRVPDDLVIVDEIMHRLPSIPFAPSLAGVTTTLSHPYTTSHRGFTEEERSAFGITRGLIRISVGIEDIADLTSEFAEALAPLKRSEA